MPSPELPDKPESEETAGFQTLTFLFTDIEDSTGHWRRTPERMRLALRRHDTLLNETCTAHQGHVFKTIGDAFCVAFHNAPTALTCALSAQRSLRAAFDGPDSDLPLRVRMALHTEAVEARDDDYFGPGLSRVARLLGLTAGGQIVLSPETASLVRHTLPEGATLTDLGRYTLKGFETPEPVLRFSHPDLATDSTLPSPPPVDTPHNLPRQLTPFVGRERETLEVRQRLATEPLVTLTGAGGCGKTRLAMHVAETCLSDFPDGVWFIDLATRTTAPQVGEAVAAVLRLRPDPGTPLGAQIAAYLAPQQTLLVLDNCEHLLDATALFAEELLRAAPGLRILATSREPLEIEGETIWPIPTLTLPAAARTLGPKRLAQYEAVQLFVERAVALSPRFRLTTENCPHIAAICRRLDGIPLALIVVAAWTNVLSPQQIVARMDDRARLLHAESHRRASGRQQTLHAAMDWSYELLSLAEKTIFRRLSVFVGGWTLEAAEAVCQDESVPDVSETLFALVRKSLVVADPTAGGAIRYRMLEPIRQYTQQLSEDQGETPDIAARHRAYYSTLAAEISPKLTGPDARPWLDTLEIEHDNLRAALTSGTRVESIALFADIFWFWYLRGHLLEGVRWSGLLLTTHDTTNATLPSYARALNGAGILAWYSGNLTVAKDYLERSLECHTANGAFDAAAGCLSNLGSLASMQGDTAGADACLRRSLELYRETGNALRIASVLTNLGGNAISTGDWTTAENYLSEAESVQRGLNQNLSLTSTLHNLAFIARRRSNFVTARERLLESLRLNWNLENKPGLAEGINELALLTHATGDELLTVKLLGIAKALHEEAGTSPSHPSTLQELSETENLLRRSLSDAEYEKEEATGRTANKAEIATYLGAS